MARVKPQTEETSEPVNLKPKPKDDRVELCMTVSHILDFRLTAQAKIQRMPRNLLVEKLLDQALSRYATDKSLKAVIAPSGEETEAAA